MVRVVSLVCKVQELIGATHKGVIFLYEEVNGWKIHCNIFSRSCFLLCKVREAKEEEKEMCI